MTQSFFGAESFRIFGIFREYDLVVMINGLNKFSKNLAWLMNIKGLLLRLFIDATHCYLFFEKCYLSDERELLPDHS